MPPLLLLAAGAIGGVALARWGLREIRRINDELAETHLAGMQGSAQQERIRTLRRDPVTGAYRPD